MAIQTREGIMMLMQINFLQNLKDFTTNMIKMQPTTKMPRASSILKRFTNIKQCRALTFMKLKNKYIILDIFSFAFDATKFSKFAHQISDKFRNLLINENRLMPNIFVPKQPVWVKDKDDLAKVATKKKYRNRKLIVEMKDLVQAMKEQISIPRGICFDQLNIRERDLPVQNDGQIIRKLGFRKLIFPLVHVNDIKQLVLFIYLEARQSPLSRVDLMVNSSMFQRK
ncbi:hypothetical protein FGO68_gene14031 [Halteria grandinella]|uniref:Uncharacterized protein n=1 Tax=Halteria grandinella TaxID=5974 RepID=A0A8J8NUI5_HALGN|nr:hypothetical protein FGO68_gene14031 [Halteria grandinella]